MHNQTSYRMNLVAQYRTLIDALAAAPAERLFVLEWHDEDDQKSVTFSEFRLLVANWAGFLQGQGVCRGHQLVLVMPQSIALMAAFVAGMKLGALPAILAYPNSRVEPMKYASGLRGVAANLKAPFVVVDENFPQALMANLRATASTAFVQAPETFEPAADSEPDLTGYSLASEGLAFIQHSAGTTGLQKGVALSHAAVLRQLTHLTDALRVHSGDRVYSWLPLYHDMGLVACFMLPMVCHLPVIMQSPTEWVQRPETMLKLIHQHQCTLAWMPNFAFQFIPRRTPEDVRSACTLSSLRVLVNCSEPVRTESMEEFDRAFAPCGLKREALQTSYALAENVFAVTQSSVDGPLTIRADGASFRSEGRIEDAPRDSAHVVSFTSSGSVLPGNHLRITSETGASLPPLSMGEILLRSDSLFEGYYNRPDLTASAMADGWYRTGDLGFIHKEQLFVVGRKKDLLIIGGENLYPQDVEEIVCRHSLVHDGRAIALGLFNPDSGTEDLVVVAEMQEPQSSFDTRQIEREIRAAVLAEIGVSVRLLFLKRPHWIVKSTAGKPSRSATRDKLLREHPQLQRD
jgi:acyl-CoA synthetase (AMP-forming)/AMP-acid ligase II